MNRNTHLIIPPLFLSVLFTVLILLALPPVFHKFEAKVTASQTFNGIGESKLFHDFNHDGKSEVISLGYNSVAKIPAIRINNFNGYICNEWPIKKGHWPEKRINSFFGDYNHNGQDEIYVFNAVHDSLFLSAVEPFGSKQFVFKNRFITSFKAMENMVDVQVQNGILADLNQDGYKEVIFSVYAGYSLQPRATFAYDIRNDTVFRSPFGYSTLQTLHASDINNDGYPEVYGTLSPPGNTNLNMPLSDSISWLIVYDHHLHYSFPPVPLNVYPGSSETCQYDFNNKKMLLVLSSYSGISKNRKSKLYLFTPKGKRLDSITLPTGKYQLYRYKTKHFDKYLLTKTLIDNDNTIYEVKKKLKLIKRFHSLNERLMSNMVDIDKDGYPEFLLQKRNRLNANDTKLVIRDHRFKHPVEVDLGDIGNEWKNVTVAHQPDGKNYLSLQNGNKWFEIEYGRNPLYDFRFLIYGLIFLVLYTLFTLLFRYQKKAIEKQHQNEKDLSELQLKTIKNQLDPHFALNILNAIGSLIGQNNTEKANELFGKYSKLTRHILLGANEISISLFDELSFVRDYLELEQFRHGNKFDFSITADENINLRKVFLPRMLVHTFAENAVKHGLRHLDDRKGNLEILVTQAGNEIHITITDNGIGRNQSKIYNKMSTGKGLHIAADMLALYNKLQQTKLSFQLFDIGQGVKVIINIPVKKEKR